jgi:hypothetical protein
MFPPLITAVNNYNDDDNKNINNKDYDGNNNKNNKQSRPGQIFEPIAPNLSTGL